ncbi:MAG: hypothetical protein H0X40_08115 [Chthoniobacterales bacterium]|nr:hypothetical protein [Chthoniobacterales bacterium]
MRAPEANARADKALLVIMALLLANIASPLRHPERSAAQSKDPAQVRLKIGPQGPRQTSEISPNEKAARATPGSARASRAVFGALAENFFPPRVADTRALGEAPSAAREARALPRRLSPNE